MWYSNPTTLTLYRPIKHFGSLTTAFIFLVDDSLAFINQSQTQVKKWDGLS